MKKFLGFLALSLVSFSSFGYADDEFRCTGTDTKGISRSLGLVFENEDMAIVTNRAGAVFPLPFVSENSKFRTYADYSYDGYGGFVELRVRNSMRVDIRGPKDIKIMFTIESHSENGLVGREVFVGACKRTDDLS